MILKKNIIRVISAALIPAVLLCGCMDISRREFIYVDFPDETTVYSESTGAEITTVTSQAYITLPEDDNENLHVFFTPQQQSFINSCFFMGDSICSGLGAYGFVKSCCAKAGVAARNIEEFTFDSGGSQVAPLTAIVNSGSKNLVFLMGTNDVNIESSEEYCTYYSSFLRKAEAVTNGAAIYILAITPVTSNSSFCYNYEIDEFNRKLKEMIEASGKPSWHYIDISLDLKDADGNLKPIYASEDGLHLTRSAYYSILSTLCRDAGIS